MIVGAQQLRPKGFHHHLLARRHRKAKQKRLMIVGLTLTSMVDMFSLLVIFLLQVFSSSPELLHVSKGMTLPTAGTGTEVKDAPVLSVDSSGVYLDQKRLGELETILVNPEPLMNSLEALRVRWQKSHPKEGFKGEINLQAHKDLPSHKIAQVMAMLPSQHFGSIQLAVISSTAHSGTP